MTQAQLETTIVDALKPSNEVKTGWLTVVNALNGKHRAQVQPIQGTRRGPDGYFYSMDTHTILPSITTRPRARRWLRWRA